MQTELVGYVRKDKNGQHLRIHLSAEVMDALGRYESRDGYKYIALVVNANKVEEILDGERDVTSVVSVPDGQDL